MSWHYLGQSARERGQRYISIILQYFWRDRRQQVAGFLSVWLTVLCSNPLVKCKRHRVNQGQVWWGKQVWPVKTPPENWVHFKMWSDSRALEAEGQDCYLGYLCISRQNPLSINYTNWLPGCLWFQSTSSPLFTLLWLLPKSALFEESFLNLPFGCQFLWLRLTIFSFYTAAAIHPYSSSMHHFITPFYWVIPSFWGA